MVREQYEQILYGMNNSGFFSPHARVWLCQTTGKVRVTTNLYLLRQWSQRNHWNCNWESMPVPAVHGLATPSNQFQTAEEQVLF